MATTHRLLLFTALLALTMLGPVAGSAAAAALTCLTGTAPVVADDASKIRALQDEIAAACPCASFDGSAHKKHADYTRCANGVIKSAVDNDQLRTQCQATVKNFHSQSTCGHLASANKVVCVSRTRSTGKVACSITAASQCATTNPLQKTENACTGFSHCIDAADTNGDLLIAGPGDSGQCNPPPPICGDGVPEGSEECDGADLRGESCVSLGLGGLGDGPLSCSASCTFDTSGCTTTLGNLAVQVFTPSGLPVVGAIVKVGTTTMTTGAGGGVEFTGLATGRTVAQVNASGFAASTAVADVVANAIVHAVARLLPLGDPVTFDAGSGTVVTRGGVTVTIEGGDVNATGAVQVTIAGLDPTTNQIALAPGPFQGIPEGSASPVDFESLFMAEIRLTQNGNPVQIVSPQTIKLDYTLPSALQDVFPDGTSIPAWHYDLIQGLWVQEGSGTIERIFDVNGTGIQHWIAFVSHLTWWNADKPYTEKNCLRVTVLRRSDNTPIAGANVHAVGVDYSGTSVAVTGASGQACVDFKKGATIKVVVEHPDFPVQEGGAIVFTGDNTPAACSGAGGPCLELPDAVFMGGQTCVSGLVKQGGSPVQDATVSVVVTGGTTSRSYTVLTDVNGSFCAPAPVGATVKVLASKTSGSDVFVADTSVTVGTAEAVCGGPGCTSVPDLNLVLLVADSCVRGRVWPAGGASEGAASVGVNSAAANTPVYLYSAFPLVPVQPTCADDPSTWGDLVASGVTDEQGYFCLAYARTPNDGDTVTRWMVAIDCNLNQKVIKDVTDSVASPDRSCDELSCLDAGDLFLCGGASGGSCGNDA